MKRRIALCMAIGVGVILLGGVAFVFAATTGLVQGDLANNVVERTPPVFFSGPREAPDFTIGTIDNGTFTLSEHRGEVVVIDLMAVNCPSCRITERAMLALHAERPNVTIVSVDIWVTLETEEELRAHMQKLNATWPAGMDTANLLEKYNAYDISKVVVIDPNGFITWQRVGGIGLEPVLEAVDEAEAGMGEAQSVPRLGLFGFAAVAGVASFFAPCAFPLLPGYMAYTVSLHHDGASGGARQRRRVRDAIVPGVAAASGILVVYGIVGVLVAALGQAASRWVPLMQPFVGVLAVALGVSLLLGASMERLVAPIQRLMDRIVQAVTGQARPGDLAGFFGYGLGYGAAAAGCTAPIFLQVSLSALAFGFVTGFKVFAMYAGMAAGLMIVATLVSMKAAHAMQRHSSTIVRVVNPAVGVIMIAAGVYLVWFYWTAFGPRGL